METMRIILIFLHTLIIIFAAVNVRNHFAFINKTANYQQRTSAILSDFTDFFCILFYHTISILVVWFNRRYGAGLIRATGILLIGELLGTNTSIIQLTLTAPHVDGGEIIFITIFDCLVMIAALITFRFAEKISIYQKNWMQVESLANTVHDISVDDSVESTID
jgi:hypothetical protein